MSGAVFISYASEDRETAKQVAESLRSLGCEIWFADDKIRDGTNFVGAINDGLAASSTVLVLWSRSAAASRWVQIERDSTYARRNSGAPMTLFIGRLDTEPLPPLFAAEQSIDLKTASTRAAALRNVFDSARQRRGDHLAERVDDAELPRAKQLNEVLRKVRRSEDVVVLAPRKGGSHAFIRQVQKRLSGIVVALARHGGTSKALSHPRPSSRPQKCAGAHRPGRERTVLGRSR